MVSIPGTDLTTLIAMTADSAGDQDVSDVEYAIKNKLKQNAIRMIQQMQEQLISLPNDSTVKIDGCWYSHAMICGAIAVLKIEHGIEDAELIGKEMW